MLQSSMVMRARSWFPLPEPYTYLERYYTAISRDFTEDQLVMIIFPCDKKKFTSLSSLSSQNATLNRHVDSSVVAQGKVINVWPPLQYVQCQEGSPDPGLAKCFIRLLWHDWRYSTCFCIPQPSPQTFITCFSGIERLAATLSSSPLYPGFILALIFLQWSASEQTPTHPLNLNHNATYR